MTRPKVGPVTERVGVMAGCALGHNWFTVQQVFFRGYGQTPSGRRSPRYETMFDVPNCPDCGGRSWTSKPADARPEVDRIHAVIAKATGGQR